MLCGSHRYAALMRHHWDERTVHKNLVNNRAHISGHYILLNTFLLQDPAICSLSDRKAPILLLYSPVTPILLR